MKVNDVEFVANARQAATIELLCNSNAGGFATVKGYVSKSGRVSPETADITFISRFSVSRLYKRKIAALEALTLADVMPELIEKDKVKAMPMEALNKAFNDRKATEIASLQKTLDGTDRDDAHRQAHDRNYVTITDGVKVHFLSEKVDGIMVPVLNEDGLPTVESIMLNIIQVSKNVTIPGEYKVVNSGVPVLISNALNNLLPKSSKIKTISLKEDNFDSLHLANMEYLPEDFKGMYTAD